MPVNSYVDAFNPELPKSDTGSASEYLKLSKGTSQIESSKAGQYLAAGIGDVIEGAAKVGDMIAKDVIQKDVWNTINPEREEFTDALEQFSAIKKAKPGSLPADAPQEVKNVGMQAAKLQAGIDSGKFNQVHYMARLNEHAKTLRAKYPGYREYIDGQISSITGVNPANAYVSQMLSDLNTKDEKKDGDLTRIMSVLHREDILGLPGTPAQIANLVRNPTQENILKATEYASQQSQWKVAEDRRKAAQAAKEAGRSDNKWGAEVDIDAGVSAKAASYTKDLLFTVTGGGQRPINDIIAEANRPGGVVPDPQQANDMARVVKQRKMEIYQERLADAQKLIPGTNESLASRAGGHEIAGKRIMAGLQGFDTMAEALSKNNFALAADAADRITAMEDKARLGLYTNPDMGNYALTAKIISKDMGNSDAATKFFTNTLNNEYNVDQKFVKWIGDMQKNMLAQPDLSVKGEQVGKPVTLKENIEILKEKGVTDKGSFAKLVLGSPKILTDPTVSDESKRKMAIALFHPNNRGLMANFSPSDVNADGRRLPSNLIQSSVYNALTSDAVTKTMWDLGKKFPGQWENYVNWAEHEFGRTMQSEIKQVNKFELPQGVRLGWDDKNHQIVMDYKGENLLTKKDVPTFTRGSTGQDFALGVQTIDEPKRILNRLNSQLYSVARVQKQDGAVDSNAYTFRLLKGLGMEGPLTQQLLESMIPKKKKEF